MPGRCAPVPGGQPAGLRIRAGSAERIPRRASCSPMSLGPLSGHMAQHILLMNVLAPALALTLIRLSLPLRGRALLAATLLQLILIWGWHAPGVLPIAANHSVLHLAMQA